MKKINYISYNIDYMKIIINKKMIYVIIWNLMILIYKHYVKIKNV